MAKESEFERTQLPIPNDALTDDQIATWRRFVIPSDQGCDMYISINSSPRSTALLLETVRRLRPDILIEE